LGAKTEIMGIVPQQYYENKKLGSWVKGQRRSYKEYKRTNGKRGDPERMKHLESIGLVDDITTGYEKGCVKQNWYDMYNQLLEFKQKHGHLTVPQRCNENKKLGMWVRHWRHYYREYKRTNGQKGDPERMKRLESIGLVDDITTGYEQRCTNSRWDDMCNQLLEFKQKHGHVKVPQRYNENKKLGTWVMNRRSNYKEYKRTNGQRGNPALMKRLESIGLVDDIIFRKKEDKKTNYATDNEVIAPIIVSSMAPVCLSDTQNITKEMPSSTGMNKGKKNCDFDSANTTQADLDFLGSELRGGFWA
jgi:hypothetical protein